MRYKKEQIKKALRLFEETQPITGTIWKLGYPIRKYFYIIKSFNINHSGSIFLLLSDWCFFLRTSNV